MIWSFVKLCIKMMTVGNIQKLLRFLSCPYTPARLSPKLQTWFLPTDLQLEAVHLGAIIWLKNDWFSPMHRNRLLLDCPEKIYCFSFTSSFRPKVWSRNRLYFFRKGLSQIFYPTEDTWITKPNILIVVWKCW